MTRAIRCSPVAGSTTRTHQIEAEVGDVREGVALVDGERGEDREDLAVEHLDKMAAVTLVQSVPVGHHDAGPTQCGRQVVGVDPALPLDETGDQTGDRSQLLGRAEPVGRPGAQSGRDLVLETGNPHLEELVQALGEDGQELDPLEERQAPVGSQVEEAGGEVEPRELAVDEALLRGKSDRSGTALFGAGHRLGPGVVASADARGVCHGGCSRRTGRGAAPRVASGPDLRGGGRPSCDLGGSGARLDHGRAPSIRSARSRQGPIPTDRIPRRTRRSGALPVSAGVGRLPLRGRARR